MGTAMNQVMSEFNAYRSMLERIKLDPRYMEGIEYGKPRPGHAE